MNQPPTELPRTYTNPENTVLVTVWPNGNCDVQIRAANHSEYGYPIRCHEEVASHGNQ